MKNGSLSLRSCDRCHAIKQRCNLPSGSTKCDRCSRLYLSCDFKRRVKGPGRPFRPYHHLQPAATPSIADITTRLDAEYMSLPRGLPGLGDPTASYDGLAMMDAVFADSRFTDIFVLGSSMGPALSRSLLSQLRNAPYLLHDAYLAWVSSMPSTLADAIVRPPAQADSAQLDFSYRRASSALATFRSCKIRSAKDVPTFLMLAGVLLAFGIVVDGDIGNKSLLICSEALTLIKPFYESGSMDTLPLDPDFLVCLIMNETTECLLRGISPTVRYRPRSRPCVDKYIGICVTLLPQLYDLANLSDDLRNIVGGDAGPRIVALEAAIQDWRPDVPPDFMDTFSSAEVSHMICQANVTQMAALLIVYRLRHPYKKENKAHALASTILAQMDSTRLMTGKSPIYLDFPLLVACLEIRDTEARKQCLDDAYSTGSLGVLRGRVEQWLEMFGNALEKREGLYWYETGGIMG